LAHAEAMDRRILRGLSTTMVANGMSDAINLDLIGRLLRGIQAQPRTLRD
jgi:hypothetical protein